MIRDSHLNIHSPVVVTHGGHQVVSNLSAPAGLTFPVEVHQGNTLFFVLALVV